MKAVLDWLSQNHAALVRGLADLVAVPSISTDGEHQKEVDQTAALTCEQMRQAGLHNVEVLRCGSSNPYAYGEWLGAPGKPTVFLYAHHDVQPINFVEEWKSEPWTLTPRDGRLFGRGAADDKGAISAELGAVTAFLKTRGSLPVNVKVLVEGEEEVGSSNLGAFFEQYKERIRSDVIVVCDTENIDTGIPSITYSLRGIVAMLVEVQGMQLPVHSGMAGGFLPDAALALDVILSRLYWKNGKLPIPHFYDKVRKMTAAEKRTLKKLPGDEAKWRHEMGMLPDVRFATEKNCHPYEQTWRKPAITVIAQEASSIKSASNQVLPKASAIVSCRIVPDQDPDEVYQQIQAVLTKDPPWGVKVTIKPQGTVKWWMTDPKGPAFEAALAAMRAGFDRKPVPIGCGGTIGFVGPLADLFGGAPALLFGIEDPRSNAHAPNESLDEGDWRKLMASLAHLFENLGKLPDGKVK
ncbi:MAG TPA: M20/M25/M40 family metallo-hydrolase [Gemmataceae bacterium]|jgi:acetylornithine deacetylase/succinyl-diaminopimelate desuccinylase-like protein|nr:M20/M25/M40 family metallo-hydrolase [Gemmataceae bacterium]